MSLLHFAILWLTVGVQHMKEYIKDLYILWMSFVLQKFMFFAGQVDLPYVQCCCVRNNIIWEHFDISLCCINNLCCYVYVGQLGVLCLGFKRSPSQSNYYMQPCMKVPQLWGNFSSLFKVSLKRSCEYWPDLSPLKIKKGIISSTWGKCTRYEINLLRCSLPSFC